MARVYHVVLLRKREQWIGLKCRINRRFIYLLFPASDYHGLTVSNNPSLNQYNTIQSQSNPWKQAKISHETFHKSKT